MSHEDFIRCQREMFYDRKQDASLQAVAEAAAGGAAGGALGGDLGGDLGGEPPAGDLELGDEAAPEGADTEPEGAEDDSTLLAAPPGTRDAPRLTPGAKGKVYYPQRTDSRPAGARTRNYASIATPEINTYRTNNLGASGLRSLARGIYEEEAPIYSLNEQKEEQKLLQVSDSVSNLLEDLKNKEEGIVEQKDES